MEEYDYQATEELLHKAQQILQRANMDIANINSSTNTSQVNEETVSMEESQSCSTDIPIGQCPNCSDTQTNSSGDVLAHADTLSSVAIDNDAVDNDADESVIFLSGSAMPKPLNVRGSLTVNNDDEVIFVGRSLGVVPVVDLSNCDNEMPAPASKKRSKRSSGESVPNIQNVFDDSAPKVSGSSILASPEKKMNMNCPVCLESFKRGLTYSTICGHVFCLSCIEQVIKLRKKCALCNRRLNMKNIHPLFLDM